MSMTDFFITKYYETGMDQLNFKYHGRDSVIIVSKNPLPGNPWVWRAEFFDAFPQVDTALAEKGWPLIGMEPVGMSLEDVFIKLTDK